MSFVNAEAASAQPTDALDIDQLLDTPTLQTLVQEQSPGWAKAVRERLQQASSALDELFVQHTDIYTLVYGRAQLIDHVLNLIWQSYDWHDNPNISLLAVGGYGRGELHPFSDIDLLILLQSDDIEPFRSNIEAFLTLLWDLNLDIGHSVRSIDECIKAAQEDITIATNLLETRTVAGNEALREALSQRVYSDEVCTDEQYFIVKHAEQRHRHEKYGDTEYNLEPNIKSSPGGLRDLQTLGWITKRHFGLGDTTQLLASGLITAEEDHLLKESERFLWKLRYGLQMVAGRNENRLLFDHQRSLCKLLGYEDTDEKLGVERMMQRYYRVALRVAELNDVILQSFDEDILNHRQTSAVVELNKRFRIRNRYIEASDDALFGRHPYALLEVFVLFAQSSGVKGVRASTIRAIRAHVHLIDEAFRQDIVNTSLFMELLKTPHDLHKTLSLMKRYNVLGNYLPEFGRVIGQMQHDLFHIYTVDAHTIKVIRNMVRLSQPESAQDYPLAEELFHKLPKRELLFIAGLYHDIAKGRGGDHSELGADDVSLFCERHRLSRRDNNLVAWLVKNHLLMSMTAQRKDIADPEIIYEFSLHIPSQVHLNYLYVLTVTDISATNPALWNSWRAILLRQLYQETTRALRRGAGEPASRQDWIQDTRADALMALQQEGYDVEAVNALWSSLDDDYFLQENTQDIVWQSQAILDHAGDPNPLVLTRNIEASDAPSLIQITVYVTAVKGLFAATVATLEQLDLNIVEARIASAEGDYSLNSFIVIDEAADNFTSADARQAQIRDTLVEELDDPGDYPEIIQRRTPRQLKLFANPTNVVFSNDAINHRTVMELITPDRPGLLARIARIFLDFDLSLVSAKITTLGERVEDVFFITDQQNQPVGDSELLQRLQTTLCEQLDEQARV